MTYLNTLVKSSAGLNRNVEGQYENIKESSKKYYKGEAFRVTTKCLHMVLSHYNVLANLWQCLKK